MASPSPREPPVIKTTFPAIDRRRPDCRFDCRIDCRIAAATSKPAPARKAAPNPIPMPIFEAVRFDFIVVDCLLKSKKCAE
jgi:hypothetical protein